MINKRMVLLKLNLFILNINSSPFFSDAISHPLYAAVDKSAPYFTRSHFMKVSIKKIDHSLISPVVVVVVADCACHLSTVYFWMS